MTTQTVGQAVAQQQDGGVGALIAKHSGSYAQVLPSHIKAETFVRLAQGLLRRNPELAAAAAQNPASFGGALLECARLGHEPGTDQYALTHFMNHKTGVPEIVGIEQYQGEIERMYRAGAVTAVKVEVVRQRDVFDWKPTRMLTPLHEFDALAGEEERGSLKGVYAYAHMHGDAISQVVVMGKSEVMKHKAVAKTKKFWEGPWEPSMWKKTAIHELEKFVPTSAEYRREQLRAAVEADNLRRIDAPTLSRPDRWVDADTGEIHDAEVVLEEQTLAEAPPESKAVS